MRGRRQAGRRVVAGEQQRRGRAALVRRERPRRRTASSTSRRTDSTQAPTSLDRHGAGQRRGGGGELDRPFGVACSSVTSSIRPIHSSDAAVGARRARPCGRRGSGRSRRPRGHGGATISGRPGASPSRPAPGSPPGPPGGRRPTSRRPCSGAERPVRARHRAGRPEQGPVRREPRTSRASASTRARNGLCGGPIGRRGERFVRSRRGPGPVTSGRWRRGTEVAGGAVPAGAADAARVVMPQPPSRPLPGPHPAAEQHQRSGRDSAMPFRDRLPG